MKCSPFLCLFPVVQLEIYLVAGKYNKVRMIQLFHKPVSGKFIAYTVGGLNFIT